MIKVYQLRIEDKYFDMNESRTCKAYVRVTFKPDAEIVSNIWHDMYEGLGYNLVAEVNTDDLADAFYLTNSIDDYWGNNPGVEEFNSKHRSTSVGDIMERDGKWYVVAPIGFTELVW